MINRGKDIIYLKGTRRSVWRVIWEKDGTFYIKLYGELIEVKRCNYGCGWGTVERY